MQRIMVDMSATLIHHGHVRLLEKASAHGRVIVGLTSDAEIFERKGYHPEMTFAQRKEILLALRHVADVVETPWLITEAILDLHAIDLLVHGDDNSNEVPAERLLLFPRTEGISSWALRERSQVSIVSSLNHQLVIAPGPAGLSEHSLAGIKPGYYDANPETRQVIDSVTSWLRQMSDHSEIEIFPCTVATVRQLAMDRYVSGRVLVDDSGDVSRQLFAQYQHQPHVELVTESDLPGIDGAADWLVAAYVDEAVADKQDLDFLRAQADRLGARLYLDATFSIGLEDDHHLADLLTFDSCHGLFGLMGAAFISHQNLPIVGPQVTIDETPPLHALQSLHGLIPHHPVIVERVKRSKQRCVSDWAQYLPPTPASRQPLLCTYFDGQAMALDDSVMLYRPENHRSGSVIYHLGEVHDDDVLITERLKMAPA